MGPKLYLDKEGVQSCLDKMVGDVRWLYYNEQRLRGDGDRKLILAGINNGGKSIAKYVFDQLDGEIGGIRLGYLNPSFQKDDRLNLPHEKGPTELPIEGIDDAHIIIIDDVYRTGRTARAAISELMSNGNERPARVHYAVLLMLEGYSEMPIAPDKFARRITQTVIEESGIDKKLLWIDVDPGLERVTLSERKVA